MGNQLICGPNVDNTRWMSKKHARNKADPNAFIIEHVQNNTHNHKIEIDTFDQRRLVFISLVGMIQTWKLCPPIQLYSALVLLPLKRDWIYHPELYSDEMHHHFISQVSSVSDSKGRNEFLELIKWKDSQNLCFWMLDHEQSTSLVHPFWEHLSNRLSDLYDPITRNKYTELHLDVQYWTKNDKYRTIQGIKPQIHQIMAELYFGTMKFKAMELIIYESNPKSLHPIRYYGSTYLPPGNGTIDAVSECFDDPHNWWISTDYDPNVA
eukprot:377679_1